MATLKSAQELKDLAMKALDRDDQAEMELYRMFGNLTDNPYFLKGFVVAIDALVSANK